MTNTRTTKRALLTSTMALFLCFAMLLGTTYAWFTDSVTSANNIIKSGTLNVEMYYADGSKAVPADDSADWQNAQGVAIYTAAQLWEPGYVDAKHIKISNVGNLALKYQLAIMPTGEVTELAEVIDVYLYQTEGVLKNATQITDRTAIDTAMHVGTLAEVINTGIVQGNLAAGTDYTTTIVLKMQESADNKYQNLSIGDNFTIQLLATQYTKEDDSFDDQYDADATFGTYIELDAGADLLAAMASAKEDMPLTIKLNGDVEWPTEGHHGENDITPASSIVIDGNGYTITATGAGVTPLGDVEAPMTLKNVKIVDNSVSYAEGAWEFTYLELGGTSLTCNNVIFADEIQTSTNAIFTNCSFLSNEESVYAVWVEDGSAAFTNCTFTGYRGLKTHEDYGTEVSSVVVQNCMFTDITKKPGIAIGTLNADTTIVITNNIFAGTQAGDQGYYSYETDTDVNGFDFVYNNNIVAGYADTNDELEGALQNGATVVLPEGEYTLPTMRDKEGITIIGAEDGSTVIGGENVSQGFGGNFGKRTTIKNVTFSGTTNGVRYSYAQGEETTFDNCTFAGGSLYGFHIDGASGATFTFNNCTFIGFNAFASDLVSVTFNNCTFLSNGNYGHTNIWSKGCFNNCTWGDNTSVSPAGSGKLFFNDVEESYYHEFIGSVESLLNFANSVNEGGDNWAGQKVSLVADIDLKDVVWTPIGQTGATTFAGSFDGQGHTIYNLKIDSTAETGAHYSSGLFGWVEIHGSKYTVIENLNIDGATVSGNHNCGTIVGYATGSAEIKNCKVTNATITCNVANSDANGDKAGVIAGNVTAGTETKVTNCTAENCTVTAGRDAGQLVGAGNVENVTGTATNVTVTANGQGTGANINNTLVGRDL